MVVQRTNAEYADGLRRIADWFEAHPAAPQPHECLRVFTANSKEQAVQLVRWLGHVEKRYDSGLFYLGHDFGGERIEFVFSQGDVCTRRVVGVEEIPEHVTPAQTREKVEWDCHPLLAPEEC